MLKEEEIKPISSVDREKTEEMFVREIKDFQSFADLQRQYGETLWTNTQEVLKSRGDMLREAFEANTAVVREAFAPVEEKPASKKAAA